MLILSPYLGKCNIKKRNFSKHSRINSWKRDHKTASSSRVLKNTNYQRLLYQHLVKKVVYIYVRHIVPEVGKYVWDIRTTWYQHLVPNDNLIPFHFISVTRYQDLVIMCEMFNYSSFIFYSATKSSFLWCVKGTQV